MKPLPPFQVIYQTAEDGLGDTVKPRLIEAEADLDRVLVIDEAKRELTLSDERIEKAITQNGARLIILDPIQAYMGEKTDMNRANEVFVMTDSRSPNTITVFRSFRSFDRREGIGNCSTNDCPVD